MTYRNNYCELLEKIQQAAVKSQRDPDDITLVAVTKNRSLEDILGLYQAGCRDFGESRVQEALPKIASAPEDIRWHFIGTLQTNKISKVIDKFTLIHSIDSFRLAEEISKRAEKKLPILLQVNTSGELTKHGLPPDEWNRCMTEVLELPNVDIQGFMTMAPLTEDQRAVRECFAGLRRFRDLMETRAGRSFPHLSMGMSGDYLIAIEEGATLLRIGSALF